MKKYLAIFLCLAVVAFASVMFVGCNQTTTEDLISDARYGIYDGQTEGFNATFVYGLREDPYKMDGISNKKVEFGVVSVVFNSDLSEEDEINYTLTIGEETYSGTLEKSPYSNEYMANIGKSCDDNSTISLSITLNSEQPVTIEMQNKNSTWNINFERAKEIGLEALKDDIAEIEDKGESYEIYVKIVGNQSSNFGTYYWIVSVVSPSTRHNVTISPTSEEILVKN